jgi:hypothetical protein
MKTQNVTIRYEVCDILSTNGSVVSREYAVALDKGTYDAVSLHPEDSKGKREKYILNVWKLLKQQGLLVITSCNWTEKELISHFSASKFYPHIDTISITVRNFIVFCVMYCRL